MKTLIKLRIRKVISIGLATIIIILSYALIIPNSLVYVLTGKGVAEHVELYFMSLNYKISFEEKQLTKNGRSTNII